MSLVEIQQPLQLLLLGLVTIAVTEILKQLGGLLKYDLSGYTAQIASAIVASILVVINALLSHIPTGFEETASAILNLIVVLLTAWGGYKALKQIVK